MTVETEETQAKIDQNLNYIDSQQQELSKILDMYEDQVQKMFEKDAATAGVNANGLRPVDEQREQTYSLAENLNKQLDDMSLNLTSMIEEINQTSNKTEGESGDPVSFVLTELTPTRYHLNETLLTSWYSIRVCWVYRSIRLCRSWTAIWPVCSGSRTARYRFSPRSRMPRGSRTRSPRNMRATAAVACSQDDRDAGKETKQDAANMNQTENKRRQSFQKSPLRRLTYSCCDACE